MCKGCAAPLHSRDEACPFCLYDPRKSSKQRRAERRQRERAHRRQAEREASE